MVYCRYRKVGVYLMVYGKNYKYDLELAKRQCNERKPTDDSMFKYLRSKGIRLNKKETGKSLKEKYRDYILKEKS